MSVRRDTTDVHGLRRIAIMVSAALLAAACGSTVQNTGRLQATGGETASGLDAPPVGSAGDGLDVPSVPGGAGGGSAPGGSAGGGDGASAGSPGVTIRDPGGGRRPVSSLARGVTDDSITIGFEYAVNSAAANAAIGAAGLSQGDDRANTRAMVKWINENGGLGGRRIKDVYHELDALSNDTTAVQEQAACATFTEDNKVFAVFTGNHTDTYHQCMQRNNVATLISNGLTISDSQRFRTFPRLLEINSLDLNAMSRLTPAGLNEMGFFKPRTGELPTKNGLVTIDSPTFRRAVERDFIPAMRRIGQTVPEVRYIAPAQRQSDIAQAGAEIAAAVLRFQSQGVTRVMLLESSATLTLLFTRSAENQGYRPRYGLNTANGGQILIDTGLAPAEQLRDAILVGWYPEFDVIREQRPTYAARKQCDAIYRKAGITFPDENARSVGWLTCDSFLFARRAFAVTAGPISPDIFVQGANALKTAYESAITGPTRFSPTRHYGTSRYRIARFFDDCRCWKYVKPWRPTPF